MIRNVLMVSTSLLLGLALPAQAQLFTEVDRVELTDIDPLTDNGRLGQRVAIAGNSVLAAAPFKDGQDGAVYSFELQADGSLGAPDALVPVDNFSQFGTALAADGDWVAVSDSQFSGRMRLFRRTGTSWIQSQEILVEDVPDTTGIVVRYLASSLAIDGDLLAIGDSQANVLDSGDTLDAAGAVVLFRRGADAVWRHEATLASSEPTTSSGFGDAVAVSGNTVLVGASSDRIDGMPHGRAHVFERSGGQWNATRVLDNPGGEEGASFGWSVALDGDIAIVGCATCNVTVDGPSNAGAFVAFERNLAGAGNWGLRGEFAGSLPDFIDNFSRSLYLRGDILLVGAPGSNSQNAYFFRRAESGAWSEASILTALEPNNIRFGSSVAFVGGRAVIGADNFPDTSTAERWGAIYAWYSGTVESCNGSFEGIFCDGFESLQ